MIETIGPIIDSIENNLYSGKYDFKAKQIKDRGRKLDIFIVNLINANILNLLGQKHGILQF